MRSQGKRTFAWALAGLGALGGAGCIGPPAPPLDASQPDPSTTSTVATTSAGEAPAGETSPNPSAGTPRFGVVGLAPSSPSIALEARAVLIDGQKLATLEPGRVQPIDALRKALTKSSGEDPAVRREFTYGLRIADDVDMASLKSVLRSAGAAHREYLALDVGGREVVLRALGSPSAPVRLHWPAATLALVVRRDSVELFRTQAARAGEASEASRVASVAAAEIEQELPAVLAPICSDAAPCNPALLFAEDGGEARWLKRALMGLAVAKLGGPAEPIVEFRLEPPPAAGKPFPITTPKAVPNDAKKPSGRLSPELIQLVVRQYYRAFRTCYEAGLGRNNKLSGRVSARFVIGRDGLVSNVTDGGSDLPDPEVVSCVLKAFYPLRFLPPEDGIVTVVYPIMLQPG